MVGCLYTKPPCTTPSSYTHWHITLSQVVDQLHYTWLLVAGREQNVQMCVTF